MLTPEQVEARIKELELQRDAELATTECVKLQYGTTHTKIKHKYAMKIGMLRKHGVENSQQLPTARAKTKQTKLERYGNAGAGNIEKMKATKIARYGNAGWNNVKSIQTKKEVYGSLSVITAKIEQTKKERYGISGIVNYEKAKQTKLERYGNPFYLNQEQGRQTRKERYGYEHFNLTAMQKTNLQKYGVPWHCMTAKCRKAAKTLSWPNIYLHDKIFDALGVDFAYETRFADNHTADLQYGNLIIEVNPAFSHNSLWSFAYKRGFTKDNWHRPETSHYERMQLAHDNGYDIIQVWDWDDLDAVVQLIGQRLTNTVSYKTGNTITIDLSKEDYRQYIARGYNIESISYTKHWYHMKRHEHIIDDDTCDAELLISKGFVYVYDAGHMTLTMHKNNAANCQQQCI